jgi:hypothetical protein
MNIWEGYLSRSPKLSNADRSRCAGSVRGRPMKSFPRSTGRHGGRSPLIRHCLQSDDKKHRHQRHGSILVVHAYAKYVVYVPGFAILGAEGRSRRNQRSVENPGCHGASLQSDYLPAVRARVDPRGGPRREQLSNRFDTVGSLSATYAIKTNTYTNRRTPGHEA